MKNIRDLLFGSCRLAIPAASSADFMTLCMEGYIYDDFSLCGEDAFFSCPLSVAKRLLPACRARGIDARVLGASGLLAILYRYRGRVGIFVGILLAAILVFCSENVLWDVRVTGNERLSAGQVKEELRAAGLCVGMPLAGIGTDGVENRLLLRSEDIAWVAVNLSGTVANVEIRETIVPSPAVDTRPVHLVAATDGEIESLEVYTGFSVASPGEIVRRGDLLVSGMSESSSGVRYTHAAGKVYARTVHEITVTIGRGREEKRALPGAWEEQTLSFFGKEIKLFGNRRRERSDCDIINYKYTYQPEGLPALPISLSVERVCPYEIVSVSRTDDEMIAAAYEELARRIGALGGVRLLRKTLTGEFTDDAYILHATLWCVENIAEEKAFEIGMSG